MVKVDDRRALVGFRNGLAWFDVETGRFETLAAGKRLGGDGLLNGPDQYLVESLIYVPENQRAYFGTGHHRFWCFDTNAGTITLLEPPRASDGPRISGSHIRRHYGALIVGNRNSDDWLWRLNVETNGFEPYQPDWVPEGNYRSGEYGGRLWPGYHHEVWIGDHAIFTDGMQLYLATPDGKKHAASGLSIRFKYPVPEGVIVGQAGRYFTDQPAPLVLMRRKNAEAGEQPTP